MQLATQFYATLCYLTTYHVNVPAIPPPVHDNNNYNQIQQVPALAQIPKSSSAPPVPASAPISAQEQVLHGQSTDKKDESEKQQRQQNDPFAPPEADPPQVFSSRQRELARDLIIKEQQIEYLISVLPGIGSSETDQKARIRQLEGELRSAEDESYRKARELSRLRKKLEAVLGAVQVGIYGDRRVH